MSIGRDLPIDPLLPGLSAALADHGAAVLHAPPGSGKTTRVPAHLLAVAPGGNERIVMLEPRRIATRAACQRIAAEQGWRVGREVGYRIRFESRAGPDTRLLIATEGVLLRLLQEDPFLEEWAVVVFDEFHERNLETDLALAMVRRVQTQARPDLKILVMSATIDPGPIAAWLGDCPVITGGARQHEVTIEYHSQGPAAPPCRGVAGEVRGILDRSSGDLLVFLPGMGEIRRVEADLADTARERDLALLPLHGALPASTQRLALTPSSRRKVVLATNVAETSLTIEGVTTVIDSGLARVLRQDTGIGLDRLELTQISRAAAHQRAGRAGRLGPGLCLRLWSEAEHRARPERETPAIRRVDLAGPILQLLAWGETDPGGFPWFERPGETALARGQSLLELLGATGPEGVTRLGRAMSALPLHPRLARLVVEGHRRGHLRPATVAAAMLEGRDLFVSHRVRRGAGSPDQDAIPPDLVRRVELLDAALAGRGGDLGFSPAALRGVERAQGQIERVARRVLGRPPTGLGRWEEALERAFLAAYPDRVGIRRSGSATRAVLVGGRGARFPDPTAAPSGRLFVAVQMAAGARGERAEGLVHLATGLDEAWLPPEDLSTRRAVEYDPDADRVVCSTVREYRDLEIERRLAKADSGDETARVLTTAAARDLHRALGLARPEVEQLVARVSFLAREMPERGLPTIDEKLLGSLLPGLCQGRRSLGELSSLPLVEIILGLLPREQRVTLDRDAPERIVVPSGSSKRLSYDEGRQPVLSVRIQEMFGMAQTPTVAGGRVQVLLHLLAPNGRPQQVTDDLAGFWADTYLEVRKELRGRYPKHSWPEDPLRATPLRGVPRRRKR